MFQVTVEPKRIYLLVMALIKNLKNKIRTALFLTTMVYDYSQKIMSP